MTGQSKINTLPPEIRLQILLNFDSYDTFCLAISSFPRTTFYEIFYTYQKTFLKRLWNTEMGGPDNAGSRSVLVHALQLACMPVYGIDNTMAKWLDSSIPNCDETIKAERRREVEQSICRFYQEARSMRWDNEFSTQQEWDFWRRRVMELQRQVEPDLVQLEPTTGDPSSKASHSSLDARKLKHLDPSSSRSPILSRRTIDFLLNRHREASDILDQFVADVLPAVTKERVEIYSLPLPDSPAFRLARARILAQYPRLKPRALSSYPISSAERNRILLAIYGLYYAADLVRLSQIQVGKDSHDVVNREDYNEQRVLWFAYDNVWQLEGISTMYEYLRSKLRAPITQLGAQLWPTERHYREHHKWHDTDSCLDPRYNWATDEKFMDKVFGYLVTDNGISTLWRQYGTTGSFDTATAVEYAEVGTKRIRLCRAVVTAGTRPTTHALPSTSGFRRLLEIAKDSPFIEQYGALGALLTPRVPSAVPNERTWLLKTNAFRDEQSIRSRAELIWRHSFRKCGDNALEMYCYRWYIRAKERYSPLRRIADAGWKGFAYGQAALQTCPLTSDWRIGMRFLGWYISSLCDELEKLYSDGLRCDLAIWDNERLKGWGFLMPRVDIVD
ncbi:hypothetical protein BJ508DRAFT_323169 [Ascobolus immersus RN42]|uniref:Uncharacterized protein n=1 Tax=Ascobolus immersus RN42 TaxID=1160509 RepID=A0A3N4ILC1_ASCIM|nr:hypothetical protein BJ508DRAFT_323169 [Ascobolus immersus RN42]